jgi:hypothetical protein
MSSMSKCQEKALIQCLSIYGPPKLEEPLGSLGVTGCTDRMHPCIQLANIQSLQAVHMSPFKSSILDPNSHEVVSARVN